MGEALAGVAGDLDLFLMGMYMLTENLKALAGTRVRKAAQRLTRSPAASLLWGLAAGTITQSMAGATFVAVSMLRGGLVELRTAIALCQGAGPGVTTLVLIVTLDAETIALCLIGASAASAGRVRRGDAEELLRHSRGVCRGVGEGRGTAAGDGHRHLA